MSQAPDLAPHAQQHLGACLSRSLTPARNSDWERGIFQVQPHGALQGCACLLFLLFSGSQQETALCCFHFIHYEGRGGRGWERNENERNALKTPEEVVLLAVKGTPFRIFTIINY